MAIPRPFSELAAVFVDLLPGYLKRHVTNDPRIIFRVPARSAEVGELLVYDEGTELTVAVGQIDHCHFEVYCESGPTERERQQQAARNAVQWIEDIIGDRVRFRNEFRAGRIIAGSSWKVDHQDGGPILESADEFKEYTWSGEKLHERRAKQ